MKIKYFTYGGAIIFSYIGWFFPALFSYGNDIVTRLFFSIIFSIVGVFIGYYFYKFLRKYFS